MATPVLLLVVIYLIYAIDLLPPARGRDARRTGRSAATRELQTTWIVVTSALVLALAAYGTTRLLADNGAGSGSGPDPAHVPEGPKLRGAGDRPAVERSPTATPPTAASRRPTSCCPSTRRLNCTSPRSTSIHSFWAYQLGVKADANPDVDNVAFVKPTKEETFEVHCAELCGIWHGGMFDHGRVVSGPAFQTWIHATAGTFAPATKVLPKYSHDLRPRTVEARRMTERAARTRAATAPAVAAAARLQPAQAVVLGVVGYYLGWFIGHQIDGAQLRIPVGHRRERRRAAARLLLRRRRLPDRPRLRQLPARPPARPAGLAAREGGRGDRALLRPVHRPQGRRHPVPGGDRRVLLRRRAQRDADPDRAAAPDADLRGPEPVHLAGRHARHDDDGDDDLGHPRPVRQLLRADHDRRAADGLPRGSRRSPSGC